MRAIDTEHLGNRQVIGVWEVDGVLVDPGPESTLETVIGALGEGFEPRAVLLTHIHFDHAGSSGALVRRFPDLPVYVHEVGAPHMADPARLVKSASRLYGEGEMQRLWGTVVPVPGANLRVLHGGETVLEHFRVEHTPGHASHHVSYLHEPSGTAFVGDVAGVRIPPADLVVAPTPPPDVDVDAWRDSIDLVRGWEPQRLALTHFGEVHSDVPGHLDRVLASLDEEIERTGRLTLEEFVATQIAALEEQVDFGTAKTYEQAVPAHHIWLGLERWRSKQP